MTTNVNTKRDVVIAPSILAADFAALGDEVAAVTAAGADWIHLDVMDGHFVPNVTIGPGVIAAIGRHTHLPLDVHLMVDPVEECIEQYVNAGASCITVHAEAATHLDRTLQRIHDFGVRSGVALNPASPHTMLDWVLESVDLVLVMTVNPGFGGQSFITSMLNKVEQIADRLPAHVDLQVDGGVAATNARQLVDAGANALVAGSAIFGASSYARAILDIRDAAAGL